MMLLPPRDDVCPICATDHEAHLPHNAHSLYYQYRFYGIRGRWPTWADAVAHCDPRMKEFWERKFRELNAWSEPTEGEPIADPPQESVHQPVGELTQPGFGPKFDAVVTQDD